MEVYVHSAIHGQCIDGHIYFCSMNCLQNVSHPEVRGLDLFIDFSLNYNRTLLRIFYSRPCVEKPHNLINSPLSPRPPGERTQGHKFVVSCWRFWIPEGIPTSTTNSSYTYIIRRRRWTEYGRRKVWEVSTVRIFFANTAKPLRGRTTQPIREGPTYN